ncbi:B3 domain-containing protein REM17-like isoform X2 [Lycium barbarum]|uniref:B3 domain-containing protein REM17-like isoform X2 n=1 Tax=Lycium barbarum TaxID=112863 RepID=UPI00293E28AB|nr:B3 domain-containing protein REM17-like isoform X2 [Lycium barbarum]
MKIRPKKPHFFKPIVPGFKNGLTIPIGFLKYLKGNRNEYAMLRRASKKWHVKVNGRRLEEGWEEFVKDHDIQLGDILVFRHEGDMEFVVTVFDLTYCEREYEQRVHEREEEKTHIIEESSKEFEFKEKPKPYIKTSGKGFPSVEAAYKDMHLSHSHFICTIIPYCLSKYCLCIPKQFAQENRLNDRKCMIIMRDEERSLTFSLYTNGKNTYIGSGWREFCITNCLKEGDRLMVEIVSNGETPIFRVHDLRGSPSLQPEVKKKNLDAERMSDKDLRLKTLDVTTSKSQVAASTSADANPHFLSTIKPYTNRYPYLYLPMDFVKSSGLMNKSEMILVDEKQISWSMWLGRTESHFGIKRGWRQFSKANGVQVGDTYKFELTNNGTIPIVHFRYLRLKTLNVTTPKSQVAASTSADANPHFISTIRPYSMTKTHLYLPMDFVKSNGLMNRSEMILVDEKQRSWSVQLGRKERHFGIKRGWRKFSKANGLQVGDTYKFELTKNGTIPIVHFHCKYTGKDARYNRSH